MKKLFVLLLLPFVFFACRHEKKEVWTKAYQHHVYDTIYRSLIMVVPDTAQRRQFATFMVQKFKAALPNGLYSVHPDSLRRLSKTIGAEFAHNNVIKRLKFTIPWTPQLEQSLRTSVLSSPKLRNVNAEAKAHYCDCTIRKLKEIYPDSLTVPIPDSVYTRVIAPCKHFANL